MKIRPGYIVFAVTVVVIGIVTRLCLSEITKVTQQSVNAWTDEQTADCAAVLTGGPNRVQEGIHLLYQKNIKKLILTGVNPNSHLEEIFPNIIFYGKLEPQNIILEKTSKTTYGNALQTLALVEALQCRDLILVTSQLHMYRAYRTFRKQFPEQITIYPRATVGRQYHPHWSYVIDEAMKSLFYRWWAY